MRRQGLKFCGWGAILAAALLLPAGAGQAAGRGGGGGHGGGGHGGGGHGGGGHGGGLHGGGHARGPLPRGPLPGGDPPHRLLLSRSFLPGDFRPFVSPPLKPDTEYRYSIKAQWQENGRPVTRTRQITVYAGDHVTVNLNGSGS